MYALITFIDNEIVDGVTYFSSYDEAYNNAVDIAQGSEQNTLVELYKVEDRFRGEIEYIDELEMEKFNMSFKFNHLEKTGS